jgi:amino acid transporter
VSEDAADGGSAARRTIGPLGATGIGVGAIVGGGILVLAGVAFQAAGPAAIVAFALNGVVALLTALSFAELSSIFPESGGAYIFAKKVLAVRAAFGVGWVLWFAYIVAGVLYAMGFAEYAAAVAAAIAQAAYGSAPAWLTGRSIVVGLALAATVAYMLSLIRKASGGGQWETVGKLALFALLIAIGAWAVLRSEPGTVSSGMTPLFPNGATGVLSAMGYSFIALQGFDLIAAVGGEVKAPTRTIPRAMLYSLGIAMLVYLPLLFIVPTVGVRPGTGIVQMSAEGPATLMADAAREFAGPAGYWMVMAAAVLSTLSALAANLLAASRVALTMARDRTLPRVLALDHATRKTPLMAIYASALAMAVILLIVPDVAAAGAAASLIFLVCFALVHWIGLLARKRSRASPPFRTPLFPLVPIVGGLACAALAAFQAVSVPSAGGIAALWLGLGATLYVALFAGRARVVDAFAEARDPALVALRGRSPVVLLPVANPASAAGLVALANVIATPVVGRVIVLAVMRRPVPADFDNGQLPPAMERAEAVVREALATSLASGHAPETLLTVADEPWSEIVRVARSEGCESLVLGLSSLEDPEDVKRLETLLNRVQCDVVLLRAPPGWSVSSVTRIVVAVGGRGGHDDLRARMLGSPGRDGQRHVVFVEVMRSDTSEPLRRQVEVQLRNFAEEETHGHPRAEIIASDDVVDALVRYAEPTDLLVVGLQQHRGRRLLSETAIRIARASNAATLLISRGG